MQHYAPIPDHSRFALHARGDGSGFFRRLDEIQAGSSTEAVHWHTARHRLILAAHPEVRKLFGADPVTALWILLLVCAQYMTAVELRRAPVWVVIVAILFVGAPIAHALGVLVHECSHNLVFRSTGANKAMAILANVGMGAPGAIAFRHQHLLHHRYLGDGSEPNGGDTQAPPLKEVLWARDSTWRKFFAFCFGRFVFEGRSSDRAPRDGWLIANQAACIIAIASLSIVAGFRSASYVMLSLFFAFGPHPLGARRISEHVTLRSDQPTVSYYGPGNRISFDVGYHVEHHDFPYVPWRRLRRLRAIASESYVSLARVKSWTGLLVDHFVNPKRNRGQYTGFERYLADAVQARQHDVDVDHRCQHV
jgi:sphingolipid delta-4 desaturase